MHSAYLEDEQGEWSVTRDIDVAIDHSGDVIINDDEDAESDNLEALATRLGFAHADNHCQDLCFTDLPLFWDGNKAIEYAKEHGTVLCRQSYGYEFYDVGKKGRKVGLSAKGEYDGAGAYSYVTGSQVGWVLEKDGDFFKLTQDFDLYHKVFAIYEKKERSDKRKGDQGDVRAGDFHRVVCACNLALDTGYAKSLRVEQCWTWMVAHDAAFGRAATNKLILDVARKWCRNRKRSKKWLGAYAKEETVTRTDKRFAAACRQGKK